MMPPLPPPRIRKIQLAEPIETRYSIETYRCLTRDCHLVAVTILAELDARPKESR